MTVVVLAVLWLIVVVPMLLKRKDDRAGELSVARFSTAMRALSTRRSVASPTRPMASYEPEPGLERPGNRSGRPHLFVPGGAGRATPVARQPVPAAMEAVMYPNRIAKADMSQARRQMMARRRRSVILLLVGTVVGLLWAIAAGGVLAWTVGFAFAAGFGCYLTSLRNQALRDRRRRESRLSRSELRADRGYDATEQYDEYDEYDDDENDIQIDDDDIRLHGVADTVDLTGLYADEQFDERPMRRAV
jgi:hypothetical protein